MAHIHSVYDNDTHFKIDTATREINNESGKVVIIQHDHDSERFTFEIPRMVEDHDMSVCNVVQVHYLNIDAATGTNEPGVYEVDDLQVSPDSDDVVICSWLISRNATQYVGSLNFVVRFRCVADDGTVEYEWATAIHRKINVCESIYNADAIVAEYADVLEKWRASLFFNTDGVTEDISMAGHKITAMGAPTEPNDAATKEYVDNAFENLDLSGVDTSGMVSKLGDIMAGQLDMNTNKIIGLADPEEDTDAANKGYVDEKVESIDVTDQLKAFEEEINSKIGGIVRFTLLWNTAGSGTFAAQSITISNLSNYAYVLVCGSFGAAFYSTYGYTQNIIECDTSSGFYTFSRDISFSGNKAVFGECASVRIGTSGSVTHSTANNECVPYMIYGVSGL